MDRSIKWRILRLYFRFTLPRCSSIIVQSVQMSAYLRRFCPSISNRIIFQSCFAIMTLSFFYPSSLYSYKNHHLLFDLSTIHLLESLDITILLTLENLSYLPISSSLQYLGEIPILMSRKSIHFLMLYYFYLLMNLMGSPFRGG